MTLILVLSRFKIELAVLAELAECSCMIGFGCIVGTVGFLG